MAKALVLLAMLLAVSVPFSAKGDQQVARQEILTAKAECDALHKARRIRTQLATEECFIEKAKHIANANGITLTIEDNLRLAKRRELAEKVDRKILTKPEADFQLTEYEAGLIRRSQAEQAQRNQQRALAEQARALEAQAEAARRAQANQQLLDAAQMLGSMGTASRLPYGAYQLPNR